MSYLFRPGQQLIPVGNPPAHMDSLPGYNTDSDNEVRDDDCITDPRWNSAANMPQDVVDDILYQDAETTRDIEPEIPLPPETKRISIDLQSLRLEKLAIPLIATCNKLCPHPGPQFNLLPLSDRSAFISMIISASILPPLEYLAQFTLIDLTSMYCLLIDSFHDELISFNINSDNPVHLSWMLRARGFSLIYGTNQLVNSNYGYNMAPIAMDILVHECFHLRRLFRIFISDVMALSASSVSSSAQLPIYFEPLSDTHRERLFGADSGLCSDFLNYIQQSFSDPRWNLSQLSTDHFAHCRLVKVSQLVQYPELFDYSYFGRLPMVLLPLVWYILYLDFYRTLSSAALLSVDNISQWLCYARAYTDWSQKIAFDQLTVLSPPHFFRYSRIVSTVVHLLYFYSDFLSDPFQTTPPRSPDANLFLHPAVSLERAVDI